MAAVEATGLTFVDEEDIPIAFLRIAHVDSENEQPSDVDSSEDEDSIDESGEENDHSNDEEEQNYSNLRWSSEIRAPQDRNFNEEGVSVGLFTKESRRRHELGIARKLL
ncbi:uncharacterized protein [Acropora muricata]|uniref:uncharacterized protein n=1 Tax=Acropora muricata TaxID=159855 RepID=UPI0034E5241D